jgi:hypothetical protein
MTMIKSEMIKNEIKLLAVILLVMFVAFFTRAIYATQPIQEANHFETSYELVLGL